MKKVDVSNNVYGHMNQNIVLVLRECNADNPRIKNKSKSFPFVPTYKMTVVAEIKT